MTLFERLSEQVTFYDILGISDNYRIVDCSERSPTAGDLRKLLAPAKAGDYWERCYTHDNIYHFDGATRKLVVAIQAVAGRE